jgi:hypothetical protein
VRVQRIGAVNEFKTTAICGTHSGYYAHFRRGETPCAHCKKIEASYRAAKRQIKSTPDAELYAELEGEKYQVVGLFHKSQATAKACEGIWRNYLRGNEGEFLWNAQKR